MHNYPATTTSWQKGGIFFFWGVALRAQVGPEKQASTDSEGEEPDRYSKRPAKCYYPEDPDKASRGDRVFKNDTSKAKQKRAMGDTG